MFLRPTQLKNHHQGIDYFRSKVQECNDILKLRSSLRIIKSNCVLCRRFGSATIQTIMADLLKARLLYQSPPFTNNGIEYFGSFYVTIRRTTEKRWGFLCTCLTTHSVHVENVRSMDTSSSAKGVERLVSRRGMPDMIWSEIGTKFIGAEKEHTERIEKCNALNIASEIVRKGVKLKFSPPRARHQVGI